MVAIVVVCVRVVWCGVRACGVVCVRVRERGGGRGERREREGGGVEAEVEVECDREGAWRSEESAGLVGR